MTQSILSRSGLALGLALALATAAAPAAGLAQAGRPDPKAAVTQMEREAFRAGLRSSGESMGVLMETYPDEYSAFETRIMTGLKSGALDMAGLRTMTAEWAMSMRARLAANIAQASDADLVNIGRSQLGVMRQLGPSRPAACYEFIENGGLTPATAGTLDDAARGQIDKLGAQQLRAAAAAIKSPVTRAPIGDADVGPILAAFKKQGGDVKWLAATTAPAEMAKFSQADRCANAQRWLETILAQPAPLAARLLAK